MIFFHYRAGEMAQRSSVSTALAQDLDSVSRHPHSGSQSSVTPFPGYLISSSDIWYGPGKHVVQYTDMHEIKTFIHLNKCFKIRILTFILCTCVHVCRDQRTTGRGWFSSSTKQVLGIQFTSSASATSAFIKWATTLALIRHYYQWKAELALPSHMYMHSDKCT